MNKYVRAAVVIPFGALKMGWIKLFHWTSFRGPAFCMVSPFTEVTIDKKAQLHIGNSFRMRDGAKIRIRRGAACSIGNNSALGTNNMIVCHERITIGDNVQFAQNVQIYDHDHDFRHADGLKANHFKTAPVEIGDNCWIGANVVILRGTKLGAGCVVGAGSVIKGEYPAASVIVQKRTTDIISYTR